MSRQCKDCLVDDRIQIKAARPAPYPGPRCATHWRAEKKRRGEVAHGRLIVNGYEMTPQQYQQLYEYQGGVCFVCRKATGAARHLAVEHEHGMEGCEHPPEKGCSRCWRALVCKRCNRLVAFLDTQALARAIVLLTHPPARELFS